MFVIVALPAVDTKNRMDPPLTPAAVPPLLVNAALPAVLRFMPPSKRIVVPVLVRIEMPPAVLLTAPLKMTVPPVEFWMSTAFRYPSSTCARRSA